MFFKLQPEYRNQFLFLKLEDTESFNMQWVCVCIRDLDLTLVKEVR